MIPWNSKWKHFMCSFYCCCFFWLFLLCFCYCCRCAQSIEIALVFIVRVYFLLCRSLFEFYLSFDIHLSSCFYSSNFNYSQNIDEISISPYILCCEWQRRAMNAGQQEKSQFEQQKWVDILHKISFSLICVDTDRFSTFKFSNIIDNAWAVCFSLFTATQTT